MRSFFTVLAVSLFAACTKYEEQIIPGNAPPPDFTISSTLYEDYVNKSHILSLGREPDSAEFAFSIDLLLQNKLSSAARSLFADSIYADVDFKNNTWEETRFALLQSTDSSDVAQQIAIFNFLLADSTNMQFWPFIQLEVVRLNDLLTAKELFLAGTIDSREVHRRMVNNYFYDQLNMGSQNLVLGVFQQLLNRQPTQHELASSVSMVDGNHSSLFLQSGSSRDDFFNIVLHSVDYYEGQVILLYEKYLLRKPTSQEMTASTLYYIATNDVIKVQKELVTSNEFAGIKSP